MYMWIRKVLLVFFFFITMIIFSIKKRVQNVQRVKIPVIILTSILLIAFVIIFVMGEIIK